MPEIDSLLLAIQNSTFIEADAIKHEIESGGAIVIEPHTGKAKEESLSKTYQVRLNNISKMNGSHAKRLSQSTAEFVKNLNIEKPEFIKTARLKIIPFGSYLIWFTPKYYKIIGCMLTVSHNEVNDEIWNEIWGENEI